MITATHKLQFEQITKIKAAEQKKFNRMRAIHSSLIVLIRVIIEIAKSDPKAINGVIASLGRKIDLNEENARKIVELEEDDKQMNEVRTMQYLKTQYDNEDRSEDLGSEPDDSFNNYSYRPQKFIFC